MKNLNWEKFSFHIISSRALSYLKVLERNNYYFRKKIAQNIFSELFPVLTWPTRYITSNYTLLNPTIIKIIRHLWKISVLGEFGHLKRVAVKFREMLKRRRIAIAEIVEGTSSQTWQLMLLFHGVFPEKLPFYNLADGSGCEPRRIAMQPLEQKKVAAWFSGVKWGRVATYKTLLLSIYIFKRNAREIVSLARSILHTSNSEYAAADITTWDDAHFFSCLPKIETRKQKKRKTHENKDMRWNRRVQSGGIIFWNVFL